MIEKLNLATPLQIQEALKLLGVKVDLSEWAVDSLNWLYLWVITGGEHPELPLFSRGVIYIGIDQSRDGGRLNYEESVRDGWHAHGLAIHRTHAHPVGGSVAFVNEDLTWIEQVAKHHGHLDEVTEGMNWLGQQADNGKLLAAVERLAIRISVHLGDVGVPVNSQFKGAWDTSNSGVRHADFLAYWVCRAISINKN